MISYFVLFITCEASNPHQLWTASSRQFQNVYTTDIFIALPSLVCGYLPKLNGVALISVLTHSDNKPFLCLIVSKPRKLTSFLLSWCKECMSSAKLCGTHALLHSILSVKMSCMLFCHSHHNCISHPQATPGFLVKALTKKPGPRLSLITWHLCHCRSFIVY